MANSNINETLLGKLQKLAALAEGTSYDGERMRAEHLLNAQLAKYDLTLDDVLNHKDEEILTEYTYRYKSAFEEKLIVNSVANCFGHTSDTFKKNFYRRRNGKCELYIKLSKTQHAIFDDFVNFHLNNWRYELEKMQKNLFYGYLENQQLYSSDPEDENDSKRRKKGKYDEMIDMFAIAQFSNMNMASYQKKVGKDALRLENK